MGNSAEKQLLSSINKSKRQAKKVIRALQEMPTRLIDDELMILSARTVEKHVCYHFTDDGTCGVNVTETVRHWDKEVRTLGVRDNSHYIKDYCISANFYIITKDFKTLSENKIFHSASSLFNWLWTNIYYALYAGKQSRKEYEIILKKQHERKRGNKVTR